MTDPIARAKALLEDQCSLPDYLGWQVIAEAERLRATHAVVLENRAHNEGELLRENAELRAAKSRMEHERQVEQSVLDDQLKIVAHLKQENDRLLGENTDRIRALEAENAELRRERWAKCQRCGVEIEPPERCFQCR